MPDEGTITLNCYYFKLTAVFSIIFLCKSRKDSICKNEISNRIGCVFYKFAFDNISNYVKSIQFAVKKLIWWKSKPETLISCGKHDVMLLNNICICNCVCICI